MGRATHPSGSGLAEKSVSWLELSSPSPSSGSPPAATPEAGAPSGGAGGASRGSTGEQLLTDSISWWSEKEEPCCSCRRRSCPSRGRGWRLVQWLGGPDTVGRGGTRGGQAG